MIKPVGKTEEKTNQEMLYSFRSKINFLMYRFYKWNEEVRNLMNRRFAELSQKEQDEWNKIEREIKTLDWVL
ncbi:MAG: hypothetical protein SV062_12465 [Thermodesulfobacteriota bacterium]|nr:hypothetical protein [Thermodesulfobacteriota bacterium]